MYLIVSLAVIACPCPRVPVPQVFLLHRNYETGFYDPLIHDTSPQLPHFSALFTVTSTGMVERAKNRKIEKW